MGTDRIKRIWKHMKSRCNNPNHISYQDYGGRGIQVCKEWLKFRNFCGWALANGYADDLTIDRKDNDMGYEPDNCRWVTYNEQVNNRRDTIIVKINDVNDTLTGWSQRTGIKRTTLVKRYHTLKWRGAELIKPIKGGI